MDGISDKVLAEEWLEELATGLAAARWADDDDYPGARSKADRQADLERARARLRLMSKLYAALCTEAAE